MKANSVAGKRNNKAQQKANRIKAEESKIGKTSVAANVLNSGVVPNEKSAKGGKKNAGKNIVTQTI